MQVVGLLPAGGQATRISPLPLSKELYPIGFQDFGETSRYRPKVVSQYLLEKMRLAGIQNTYFILRPGKWDIPGYFGDGSIIDMNIGYLIMNLPYGVPFTLDQAYTFIQDKIVALGFPDILFQPENAYTKILQRLTTNQVDIVLGLFPTDKPQKAGMVDFDERGKVRQIIEKPKETNLKYMWGIAVWQPSFTEFLHNYLIPIKQQNNLPQMPEIPIGDVIKAAITHGLKVEAEVFIDGSYLDIGTPDDLLQAVQKFSIIA
ncbi:dTDP-glucose pyrophosphorylase [Calothrix sp. 336/3]|nr:dTDP-glucose pyrophosphorylase [Calothrix sp. 336/3]